MYVFGSGRCGWIGGEWMRELGLGFTNPLGTGGVLDMCLCFGCGGVGGVGGEWFADHNCIHAMIAMINKHPIIKLNVATSQSYSSFVHSVKHEILGGYGVRCIIDSCYVCSSG